MAISNAQGKINELERKKANASASRPVVDKPGQVYDPGSGPRPTQTVSPSSGQTVSTPSQKRGPRNGRAGTSPLLTDSQARSAYSSMQKKNASNAMSVGILTGQDMSAYRGNLFSPASPTQPTYRGAMAEVYRMNQVDPAAASQVFTEVQNARFDPTSPYYDPFAKTTNRAAEKMQELGYDVSNIDDAWFERYAYLRQYYVPTANTNSLSTTMTNKRSTPEQQAAYYYNQLYMAREATKKTQQETDALEQELKYWTSRKDLNLSDDQIISRIDWSKYPTLSKIDSYRSGELDSGTPMELNAPVRYNKDWMYGTLWAARNNGGTDNDISNMINSVLGIGNTWKQDAELADKLNPASPNYDRYSVGMTFDEAGKYFGRTSFDREWIEANRDRYLNSSNETDRKMFVKVEKAEQTTEAAEAELEDLKTQIAWELRKATLEKNGQKKATDVVDRLLADGYIDKDGVTHRFTTLNKMDDSLALGDADGLVLTTRAVNYRKQTILDYAMSIVTENSEKMNGDATVQSFTPAVANTDKFGTVKQVEEPNENGVDAMSDVVPNGPSASAEKPASAINAEAPVGESQAVSTEEPQKENTENESGSEFDGANASDVSAPGDDANTVDALTGPDAPVSRPGHSEMGEGGTNAPVDKASAGQNEAASKDRILTPRKPTASQPEQRDMKVQETVRAPGSPYVQAPQEEKEDQVVGAAKEDAILTGQTEDRIAPSNIVASALSEHMTGVQLQEKLQDEKLDEGVSALGGKMTLAEKTFFDNVPSSSFERTRASMIDGPLNPKLWEDPTYAEHNFLQAQKRAEDDYISTAMGSVVLRNTFETRRQDAIDLQAEIDADWQKWGDLIVAAQEIPEEITFDYQNGAQSGTMSIYLNHDTGTYELGLNAYLDPEAQAQVDASIQSANANAASIRAAREKVGNAYLNPPEDMPSQELMDRKQQRVYELNDWCINNQQAYDEAMGALTASKNRWSRINATLLRNGYTISDPANVETLIDCASQFCQPVTPEANSEDSLSSYLFKGYTDTFYDNGVGEKGTIQEGMAFAESEMQRIDQLIPDLEYVLDTMGDMMPDEVKQNMQGYMDWLRQQKTQFEGFQLSQDHGFETLVSRGKEIDYEAARGMRDDGQAKWFFHNIVGDELLTDEESDIYFALLGKYGYEKADEYYRALEPTLIFRDRSNWSKATHSVAEEGVLGRAAVVAWGVAVTPVEILSSGIDIGYTIINKIATGRSKGSEVLRTPGKYSKLAYQSAQQVVKELYSDAEGNLTTKGKIVSGLYEIGYNQGRSAMAFYTFGGLIPDMTLGRLAGTPFADAANSIVHAFPIALGAADDKFQESLDSGVSFGKSLLLGLIQFASESGTEGIRFKWYNKFFGGASGLTSGFTEFLKEFPSEALAEMVGESINDIVEIGSDKWLAGSKGEHAKAVRAKEAEYYGPYSAESEVNRDEGHRVLHTAIISFFSPLFGGAKAAYNDVIQYGKFAIQVQDAKARGNNDITIRSLRENHIAKMRFAESQYEAEQVRAAEINRRRRKKGQPITEETDTGTGTVTETQAQPEAKAPTAPVSPLAISDRIVNNQVQDYDTDLIVLDGVRGSDQTTTTATISAVLQTDADNQSRADAAAVNMGNVFDGDVIDALSEVLSGGMVAEVNANVLKLGIQYAALADGAARQVVKSGAFQLASPDDQARMLAEAVIKDATDENVQNQVKESVHNFRVAEAEARILMNGAAEQAQAQQEEARNARRTANSNQDNLETASSEAQAARDAAVNAGNEAINNPLGEDNNLVNEQRKAIGATVAEEQAHKKWTESEQKARAAEQKSDRTTDETMVNVRSQAEQEVAELEAQEAEQKTQAEETARLAKEAMDAEASRIISMNNAARADAESFLDQFYPNANTRQRNEIARRFIDAYGERASDELLYRRHTLKNASEKFGVNIVIGDVIANENGEHGEAVYDEKTNTITIDPLMTVDDAMYRVLAHELTHKAQQSKYYNEFADMFLSMKYGEGTTYEGLVTGLEAGKNDSRALQDALDRQELYSKKLNRNVGNEETAQEIVAKAIETEFLKNNNLVPAVYKLVNTNPPGLVRRLINSFKQFINKARGIDGTWKDNLQNAINLMEKALLDARKANPILNAIDQAPVRSQFSLTPTAPVERLNNGLVATHVLTVDNLSKMTKLEGLPAISIAVAQNNGLALNDWFGSGNDKVTLVFDQSTIDPEANPDNHIFRDDFGTPLFPATTEKGLFKKRQVFVDNGQPVTAEGAVDLMRNEPLRFQYGKQFADYENDAGIVKYLSVNLSHPYNSLEEVKADRGRLGAKQSETVGYGDVQGETEALANRMSELKLKITGDIEAAGKVYTWADSSRSMANDVVSMFEALDRGDTAMLQEYGITEATQEEMAEFLDEMQSVRSRYAEAKPMRVLDWSEVKVAVIPESAREKTTELANFLESNGTEVLYDNPAQRGKTLNESDAVSRRMFSLADETRQANTEYMNAVRKGDMDTAQEYVDALAERQGYTVRGDHGTVSKYFTVFDRSKGNVEGNFGAGFYFSNNTDDVDANYASENGPDLNMKIQSMAEQMMWMDEYEGLDYDELVEIARKELAGGEPRVIHAALRMTNPVVIGGDNETRFDITYDEENGTVDGPLADYVEALNDVLGDYDWHTVDTSRILEEGIDYDGLTARDVEKLSREILTDVIDENGKYAAGEIIREAFERAGYDGIVDNTVGQKFRRMDGMTSDTTHYIVFQPEQIKQTDPVTYDDQGQVIPLTERFNVGNPDIRYSLPEEREATPLVTSDSGDAIVSQLPGGTVTANQQFSLSSWTEKEIGKVRKNLEKNGFAGEQIDKWISDINSVAAIIAEDKDRLDFTPDLLQKFKKPNGDVYKWTLDASTLCAKRLLYQGTFNAIQKVMPNTPLYAGDLIDLSNMMRDMGYQTPCGICYVESQRRDSGKFTEEFIAKYKSEHEGEFVPTYADLTTSDGLYKLRDEHPEVYKAYIKANNARGSASTKPVQLRTNYRGDVRNLTNDSIEYLKTIGGLRIQSFSDFETPHLMDMMQAVLDMAAVKLTSQAYTKVPNFAWVFGDTGIKINLSLMGEGTGVDENGNLIFSSTEGMDFEQAMKLRDRYSKNVGTILVGMNDAHILAAMADPRIDYIIPFHRSGWSEENRARMTSLANYKDYQDYQNERDIATGRKTEANIEPGYVVNEDGTTNGYWDYNKSGKENAEAYLKLCAEKGLIPKFEQFLVNNGDGSYSLQPDGSTDGYWKLLIDFKMYENGGDGSQGVVIGAPQQAVTPNINMQEAERVLAEFDGTGVNSLPVANDVVMKYVQQKAAERGIVVTPKNFSDAGIQVTEADMAESDRLARQNTPFAATASTADMTMGNTPSTNTEEFMPAQPKARYADEDSRLFSLPDITELPSDAVLDRKIRDFIEAGGNLSEIGRRRWGSEKIQSSDVRQSVKEFVDKRAWYLKDHNADQIDRAVDWMLEFRNERADPTGLFGALQEVRKKTFNAASADGRARLVTMMAVAAQYADPSMEAEIAAIYDVGSTHAGQALQACKLWRMATPEGRQQILQNEVDHLNQRFIDQGSDTRITLDDLLLAAAASAQTEEQYKRVMKEARAEINRQIPVNWRERIQAFRMLSMLLNVPTHVRNVLGNMFFVPVVASKNKAGAVAEIMAQASGAIKQSERTKTLVPFVSKQIRDFVRADAEAMQDELRGEGKWSEGDLRQRERKVFGTKDNIVSKTVGKALQKLVDFNGWALEGEDWIFLKGHYMRALGGLMTARGLTPADMKGKVLEDAQAYAVLEAQKATYRDASAVADVLGNLASRYHGDNDKAQAGLRFLQFIVDARFPFKKTPINIGKRGIEYSPVSVFKFGYDVKHLNQYLKAVKNNTEIPKNAISPTQFIDKVASGLTGTGIAALGYLFGAFGWARGALDLDDPEDLLAKLRGEQQYSIMPKRIVEGIGKLFDDKFTCELFGEDISQTLDWAAPVCLPFFTGVSIASTVLNRDSDGSVFKKVLKAFTEITEPMLSMSMLQSVNEMFNTNEQSDTSHLAQFLLGTFTNYGSSLWPAFFGKVAKTIDPVRRATYVRSGSEFPILEREREMLENKVPYLSMTNVPYRDALGNESEHYLPPFVENFLSPAYFSRVKSGDEVLNEIGRLLDVTKGIDGINRKAIVPAAPEKTYSVKKETVRLTAEQHDQLAEEQGQLTAKYLEELVFSDAYQAADDETRVNMVNDVYAYAKRVALHHLDDRVALNDSGHSWIETAYKKGNVIDSIVDSNVSKNRTAYIGFYSTEAAKALDEGREEDLETCMGMLEWAGAEPGDIRTKMTTYFKPLYQDAYEESLKTGDDEAVDEITEKLVDLGIGYNNRDHFRKWRAPVDKILNPDYEEDEEEAEEEPYKWLSPSSIAPTEQ